MTDVHICRAQAVARALRKFACDNCGCDRWHTVIFYEWYGPSGTCLRCGESFEGNEYLPRPFARGWRKESIRQAKVTWRRLRDAGVPGRWA